MAAMLLVLLLALSVPALCAEDTAPPPVPAPATVAGYLVLEQDDAATVVDTPIGPVKVLRDALEGNLGDAIAGLVRSAAAAGVTSARERPVECSRSLVGGLRLRDDRTS
ncbi:MAG: hypothetical protein H0W72_08620 [Planctomycetes bacterium]|nr:hypothetical protein [Planctomycetota bacterium]